MRFDRVMIGPAHRRIVWGCVATLAAVVLPGVAPRATAAPASTLPIVFSTAKGEIAKVNADGSGRQLLTADLDGQSFPESYRSPDLSPDGSRVVFIICYGVVTGSGTPCDLAAINIDGSGFRPLEGPTNVSVPRWSPDGRRIAYGEVNTPTPRVMVTNADGTGTRAVTAGFNPSWNPDGTSLVFANTKPTKNADGSLEGALFSVPLDGSGPPHQITPDLARLPSSPSWSPDGSRIAFEEETLAGQSMIDVINPDGSGFRRVLPWGDSPDLLNRRPAWSPDGDSLAVSQSNADRTGTVLVIHDLTTAAVTTVTDDVQTPSWASPSSVVPCGPGSNYWLAASDGGIFSFGGAPFHGSAADRRLNKPIVSITGLGGAGYWLVAGDGGIFSFGAARFYGSTGGLRLNQPIVGMARTLSGKGYWLVAADGGVFSFGDASFHGSTGNMKLNRPIVGMAVYSDEGYWLVAADGGVFAFGDAPFHGSTGALRLNRPIVAMVPSPAGYWLLGGDGGVFPIGDAAELGSAAVPGLPAPITAATASYPARSLLVAAADGAVIPFGRARFCGSMYARHLAKPIVGIAAADPPTL